MPPPGRQRADRLAYGNYTGEYRETLLIPESFWTAPNPGPTLQTSPDIKERQMVAMKTTSFPESKVDPGQPRPGQSRPGQSRPGQSRPGQSTGVMGRIKAKPTLHAQNRRTLWLSMPALTLISAFSFADSDLSDWQTTSIAARSASTFSLSQQDSLRPHEVQQAATRVPLSHWRPFYLTGDQDARDSQNPETDRLVEAHPDSRSAQKAGRNARRKSEANRQRVDPIHRDDDLSFSVR